MRALGLDIGGTSVKAALLVDGSPVATARSGTYARPDRRTLLESARQAAGEVTGTRGVDAVGLCVPGLLDEQTQRTTYSANVPGMVGLSLTELVAGAVGPAKSAPPTVWTDAHAAAYDLWVTESPRLAGRLLALSLGTGVGACVLDEGVPLLVSGRSPGHLGQLDVTIHEPGREVPVGPDGSRGGLEAYVGLPAMMERYGCDVEHIPNHLARDPVPMLALARAIRIGHAIYRPRHVRLLGGLGLVMQPYRDAIKSMVDKDLTGVARADWTLGFGRTAFHAACGAARLALGQ